MRTRWWRCTPKPSSKPSASRSSLAADGAKRHWQAVGVALPGLVANGVVEEAPNLPQLKGARIQELRRRTSSRSHGIDSPGDDRQRRRRIAPPGSPQSHGKLDSMIRVWTLGVGIGYGRYPLQPGCLGGRPHRRHARRQGALLRLRRTRPPGRHHGPPRHAAALPGHGAGRGLRSRQTTHRQCDDQRCLEFKRLWHKALAAATATSIHMAGPASSSSPASTCASSTCPC